MTGSARIRVVVVDDEPLVRVALAAIVDSEADMCLVGEAADGRDGVRVAREVDADVVVMDVRMPGMGGVDATRLLSEGRDGDGRGVPMVLVLTTFDDDEAVRDALRAGASGYLLKSAAPRILPEAIRAVHARQAWLDPVVARRMLSDFVARPDVPRATPEMMASLTPREREVLVLIAHGLTNADIGAHLVLSETTVKTHVGHVFLKLGLRDRAQAVAAAYTSGLVRPGDPPPR